MATRKVKADFHNHLRTSSRLADSDFNRAVDIAECRLGSGGTFGMINFDDKRYEKFIGFKGYNRDYIGENKNAIYIPGKDILIVKGQEVPTQQGHLLILGLGYDEHIKQNQTLEDTIKESRDKEATIILDHPFCKIACGAGEFLRKRENHNLLKYIDALEVHNGEVSLFPPSNIKAKIFYNSISTYNVGAISTSDGHSFYELGTSWTEIDEIDRDKGKFLESLRKSVQETKYSKRENSASLVGALEHGIYVKFTIPFLSKIGLSRLFDTERPLQ
ncbi:MAG: hypothetical protein AABX93_02240 [Nanoarchaeota archaeon]